MIEGFDFIQKILGEKSVFDRSKMKIFIKWLINSFESEQLTEARFLV